MDPNRNTNNPITYDKLRGVLKTIQQENNEEKQISEQDKNFLGKTFGYPTKGYSRVAAGDGDLSASTTSTSLDTDFGVNNQLDANQQPLQKLRPYSPIKEHNQISEGSTSDEEDEDYQTTRLLFQKQRQVSLDSKRKVKMEMDLKSLKDDNLRIAVPYVAPLNGDTNKEKMEKENSVVNLGPNVYQKTTQPIYLATQILAALTVSLGSMVVGFSSGYTGTALESMKKNETFTMTEEEGSWVGGLMPLAALAGGILGGPLIEYLGRKMTILLTAPPFIIGYLLIAFATSVTYVYVGRSLGGFCIGIASLVFPVYLGETIQAEVRGTLGLLPTGLGNIGILVSFTAGKYLNWSQLAFLGAALPVPFLILMFFIPETPRWYAAKGRENQALKSLQWLRGKNTDVSSELNEIFESQRESEKHSTKFAIIDLVTKTNNLKPLLICLGLMFFQQLSGINAVIFYTATIFKDAGSTIDEHVCTIIVGAVNFGATFLATVLIDRLGRKILLYISSVMMTITLVTLGTFFYFKDPEIIDTTYGWLPLASFVIYVVGFSLGFGPVPWLMMGEILPTQVRGSAASVVTAFNWTGTFVVTKTFLDIKNAIGIDGAFWMFGIICFVGLFFVIFCVPETRGRSLDEIEKRMQGKNTKCRKNSMPSC